MRRLRKSRLWQALTAQQRRGRTVTKSDEKHAPVEFAAGVSHPQPGPKVKEEEEGGISKGLADSGGTLKHQGLQCKASSQIIPRPSTPRLTIGNGKLPVELLQQIFSYLDFLSLTSCRFVSQYFRACLRQDFTTQYDRFLHVDPGTLLTQSYARLVFHITVTRSPLSAQGCTTDTYTATFARVAPVRFGYSSVVTTPHPVLLQLAQALTLVHHPSGATSISSGLIRTFDDADYNAEWKELLACVPPIGRLVVSCDFRGGYGACEQGGKAKWHLDGTERIQMVAGKEDRGVLLVDVVSALESMMAEVMRGTVEPYNYLKGSLWCTVEGSESAKSLQA